MSFRRRDQPARFGHVEGRQRVHDVRERLDVHAAEAQHNDRAELLVVDHAEQQLDARGRDHRRDERARADALRQILIGGGERCGSSRG